MADAVAKDKLGMGFNNPIFAYDINTGKKRPGIEIAPIDINDNGMLDPEEDFYETFDGVLQAIGSGVYPSPPARELYFVAKGKPQKQATLEFIRWCLTEGQQYVKEAGYVPIDSEKIESYLKKLK
jgi:phosphate transport system substrate-binding protein